MKAVGRICDEVVPWDDVKKSATYSSSSSLSSLGRATSSSSCFLLRVDIVGGVDGVDFLVE